MELLINSLIFMADVTGDIIPLGEYLSAPWDWFLGLGTITRIVVVVFGAAAFYIILRLFYKMVEAFVSLFQ